MEPGRLRRSDRVSLTLLLEVSGADSSGHEFKLPARTLQINRTGAVIILDRDLPDGQQLQIQRRAPAETGRKSDVRVVGQFGRQKEGHLYGVEILDPAADLWGVDFPPIAESPEAVARMLLECTYCHSREVVYLNELELRAFETNRGIARHCKTCGVPSIWTQAPHEEEQKLSARAARSKRGGDGQGSVPPGGEQRERRRLRLKTRLTACIRQTDADDELAVCEDISPVGMCFRSKRNYHAGALIEVAVPYSPDAANIFLPARVVYSEQMPKAGLFRHGTEYRKSGEPAQAAAAPSASQPSR
jgi:PilZ domain